MAYIDFASETGGLSGAASTLPVILPRHDPLPDEEIGLGALEWAVVAIARNDRLSSLRQPGRMAMALGTVFGAKHNPRLADPKLEALRRMAVLSWHYGYTVPSSELRAFTSAGFTTDQYETLLASIGSARINRKPRR
ncbi:hypothetical protein M0208_06555 [Sphingomonas sp. SUN019]|uniref:hypothetical protein n=1 Tax=Sphingomonas sp. SUN019 TaxID=2937788 RepID=UPI0021647ABA|nr:hypothetical protein [Sphingomonas sp. SUN019]UVO50197.1 hypothetical protein M0208_06555 [Sphingomonas sp. SUN019]